MKYFQMALQQISVVLSDFMSDMERCKSLNSYRIIIFY